MTCVPRPRRGRGAASAALWFLDQRSPEAPREDDLGFNLRRLALLPEEEHKFNNKFLHLYPCYPFFFVLRVISYAKPSSRVFRRTQASPRFLLSFSLNRLFQNTFSHGAGIEKMSRSANLRLLVLHALMDGGSVYFTFRRLFVVRALHRAAPRLPLSTARSKKKASARRTGS